MMFWGEVCYKNSTIIGNVMKHKSDATSTWKTVISNVKPMGNSISRVRIKNDTVLLCNNITIVCESEVIAVERIVPYSHWHLSKIKR